MIIQINDNLKFLTRVELAQIMQYVEKLNSTIDDVFLNKESNTIFGKSREFYRLVILNKVYTIFNYIASRIAQQMDECRERLENSSEKVYALLETLQNINSNELYEYYNKILENIALCEEILSDEMVCKDIEKSNIPYLQLLLAKIYTFENYFNSDKAIYWANRAEESVKIYTENSFEHYIDIITFKCNLLYEIDRKQASEYAKTTYDYLYHEYDIDNIKVQGALLVLKSNFNFTEYKKDADTLLEKYDAEKDVDKILYLWVILKENYYTSNILEKYILSYKDVELTEDNVELLEKLLIGTGYQIKLNDKETTIEIYDKLYKYYIKKYGLNNEGTLYILDKLKTLYVNNYQDERGIEICNQIIEANKSLYGENSINTIQSHKNLRYCYYVLGQYEKAIEVGNTMIGLYEKYIPDDIEDIVNEKQQIAVAASYINHTKAIELEQRLLTTYSEYYEKNPSKYYRTLKSIGINKSCIEDINVKKDGINDTLKVYEYLKKTLPERNVEIREILKNLKIYYNDINDYENSIKYCKELCDILNKYEHHSKEHLKWLTSLGSEYLALEDYGKAVKILNYILPLYQQEYGNEDEHTILIMKAIVGCYKQLNQHQKAIDFVLQEDVLSGDAKKEYNGNFLRIGIAECIENKDYENEFLYAEEYYSLCKEGEDTEELLRAKRILMTAYSDIDKKEEALSLARELEEEIRKFYIDCNNESFVRNLNDILYIYLKYNETSEMIRIAEELRPLAEKNCDHESGLYKKAIKKCDDVEKIKMGEE